MSKVHDFVEDTSLEYNRTVFCRRCGVVAWFYNREAEWNIENLQPKLGDCIDDGLDINKPPKTPKESK